MVFHLHGEGKLVLLNGVLRMTVQNDHIPAVIFAALRFCHIAIILLFLMRCYLDSAAFTPHSLHERR